MFYRLHQYKLALEATRLPEGQEKWEALQQLSSLLTHDMAVEENKIAMAEAMVALFERRGSDGT